MNEKLTVIGVLLFSPRIWHMVTRSIHAAHSEEDRGLGQRNAASIPTQSIATNEGLGPSICASPASTVGHPLDHFAAGLASARRLIATTAGNASNAFRNSEWAATAQHRAADDEVSPRTQN
jgi:hypothetical protein